MEPNNCPICSGKAMHYVRTMANGDCHGSVVCTKCGFYITSDDVRGNTILVDYWNDYTNRIRTRPKQVRCPSCNRFMKHWYNNTQGAKLLRFYCTCNTEDTVQATTFIRRRVSYTSSAVRKHWFREDNVFTGSAYKGMHQWVLNMSKEV